MSGGAGGRTPPRWADDERLARAAWSRLSEPTDVDAGRLVRRLGAVEALALVLTGGDVPWEVVGEDGETEVVARRRASRARERWHVRVPSLAPERDVAVAGNLGVRLVVPGDEEWPADRLGDLGDGVPHGLWLRGPLHLAEATRRSVALVGSRASTAYGERVAAELAAGVGDGGWAVVSGGAFGIDAAAHRGALASGTPTLAVLACGADRVYPRGNEDLLTRVAEEGLLVSELPPGNAPTRWRFLQRNRLIAALPAAVVVVEASWRSGALSTAGHAAGIGRALGAVPGPVTSSTSAGCHRILRDYGAACVTDAAEVAELAGGLGAPPPPAPPVPRREHDDLSDLEVVVMDAVPKVAARPTEAICRVAGLPAREVLTVLGRLTLRGLVEREVTSAGTVWRRARDRRSERLVSTRPPR